MSEAVLLLLVEDEPVLQIMLDDGLREAGFEPVLAVDGVAALRELAADAGRFRLLLTDIRLGTGPSGWDVGRRARELVPGMPIIYMSGDSAAEWSSKGVPTSVMIQKPFVLAQIVTAIATLLNQADV